MNLDTIRNTLNSYLYQEKNFLYMGMRGQNELFHGKIIHIYPRTFLVETDDHILKSFSYSDFATRILKIV